MNLQAIAIRAASLTAATICTSSCGGEDDIGTAGASGVPVAAEDIGSAYEETSEAIRTAPKRAMGQTGLAGARGGARVKVMVEGAHEVLVPIPQLADAQIPVLYSLKATPGGALVDIKVVKRDPSNAALKLRLKGAKNQEIQILWAAVILVTDEVAAPNVSRPGDFLRATPCVQAGAEPVIRLSEKLWPEDGNARSFAANIQEFIHGMKQVKRPVSMDAVGILESRGNWICTANANLAAALLRAKEIPARSIAVIPPNGQPLEMHRIVEYYDGEKWVGFDPSSLTRDIPTRPWHSIIMAKTTVADEEVAMRPRMGVSPGCPYGHELEFLDGGMALWGKNFFWTEARPLAEFEVGEEAIGLAKVAWERFLKSGGVSPGQPAAAAANDGEAFLNGMKKNPSGR